MRSHPSVCLSFTLACLLVAAATDAPAQGRRSGAAGQADAPPAPGRRGGGAAAEAFVRVFSEYVIDCHCHSRRGGNPAGDGE